MERYKRRKYMTEVNLELATIYNCKSKMKMGMGLGLGRGRSINSPRNYFALAML